MGDDLMSVVYVASVWIIPVLLAVTLHEVAHGWTTGKLGDYTAPAMGRVSFIPLRHIEPAGTVALPGFLPPALTSLLARFEKNWLCDHHRNNVCVSVSEPPVGTEI